MTEAGTPTRTLMGHVDMESPAEEFTQAWQSAGETDRREFMDDLLMETLLAEVFAEHAQAKRRARTRWAFGLAAAAVLAGAMAIGWMAWGGRYPRPELSGECTVATLDGREVSADKMSRGCRVKATGETRLKMRGLYELTLDAGTEIVWEGAQKQEVIGLDVGRMRSVVEPGKGTFAVDTPRGSLKVVGTDFVTEVKKSELGPAVTVTVTAGTVACEFDHRSEMLSAGMTRAFAAATEPQPKPAEEAKPPERPEGELSGVVKDTEGLRTDEGVQLKLIITTEKGEELAFLAGPKNAQAFALVGGLKPGEKVRVGWTSERSDKKFIRSIRRMEGAK